MKRSPTRTALARLGAASATMIAIGIVVSPSHAQCQYEVTIIQSDLDCGPFGDPITIPTGMNELGHVVGYHYCLLPETAVPFLWTPALGFVSLGLPPGASSAQAEDVNEDLQIVGSMDPAGPSGQHGFVWQNGEWITLLPEGDGIFSGAFANNSVGQAAGYRDHDNGTGYFRYAFLWEDHVFIDILPLAPPEVGNISLATDVSDSSAVVGYMRWAPEYNNHAFLFEGREVIDLGVIPGGFTSEGRAINSLGEIAVTGRLVDKGTGAVVTRGFLWSGREMIDLGTLPGFDRCAAVDLNDVAEVIGGCDQIANPNNDHPFIWKDGVMTDLNDLIAPDLGIIIKRAEAINNAGQIISRATIANGTVAVLLTPFDPPLGDLDGDCTVGIFDLLGLLANWGPCGACGADLDGDGIVGIFDLLTLLANWG